MRIETLSAAKAHDAYLICKDSHPVPWSFDVFADCLKPPYFAFQLNNEQGIAAYYIALVVADEVTLMDIAVTQQCRGQGLGRELLLHCLLQAKKYAATSCWLEVRQSNAAAIRLYKASGFDVIETRKDYYRNPADNNGMISYENAIVMKCALA